MRAILLSSVLLCGLAFGAGAQTPAPAPEAITPPVMCKDGTAATGTGRSPCRGHGGVQRTAAPAPVATPAPAPAADGTVTPPVTPQRGQRAPLRAQAAGGGPGLVWVNTRSKIYHCPNDRYYGRTTRGSYMTEPAAKAAGARIEHGESC